MKCKKIKRINNVNKDYKLVKQDVKRVKTYKQDIIT